MVAIPQAPQASRYWYIYLNVALPELQSHPTSADPVARTRGIHPPSIPAINPAVSSIRITREMVAVKQGMVHLVTRLSTPRLRR